MSTLHAPLAPADVEALRAAVEGAVLLPDDPDYAATCAPWNRSFTQSPAIAVAATSTRDVAAAVRFAADHGLGVAVQATGHGMVRAADDNLLLVTSGMTGVRVDPDARTAWVAAGAKWGAVLEPAQSVGLAPLLGSSPDVGAVGYTLGGGLGWLARRHGVAADSVRWFEVVTADGEVVRASADEHAELFWALRGGGGGAFGVVTGMEIDLYPVTDVYGGNLLYPAEDAREVLARWREWIADAPQELTSSVCLMNFPPIEDVPEPVRGRSFAIVRGCWSGDLAEGQERLGFWREWRTPALDLWGPMPFGAVATISNDPVDPMPAAASTEWLAELSDEAIDVVAEQTFTGGPSTIVFVEIRHVGGAVATGEAARRGAYGNRESELLLEAVGMAPVPDLTPVLEAQMAALHGALRPFVTGRTYLNFTEGEEKVARTRSAFDDATWERLVAVKAAYDPDDAFRFGLPIPSVTVLAEDR